MKKAFFGVLVIGMAVGLGLFFLLRSQEITFKNTAQSASYIEYSFDSGEDRDMGFTHRAFEKLESESHLLSKGSQIIPDQEITLLPPGTDLSQSTYTWGTDRYDVMPQSEKDGSKVYQVLLNGRLLFAEKMEYGADGPIQDARIVDGKPAFTFRTTDCWFEEANRQNCHQDIWYDGQILSKTLNVTNPRYLFSHDNKLGFVASHEGMDAIFYNGRFITEGFDEIWTHNCCAMQEILPTLYQNGTLLFHGIRDEKPYLAEIRLESLGI